MDSDNDGTLDYVWYATYDSNGYWTLQEARDLSGQALLTYAATNNADGNQLSYTIDFYLAHLQLPILKLIETYDANGNNIAYYRDGTQDDGGADGVWDAIASVFTTNTTMIVKNRSISRAFSS